MAWESVVYMLLGIATAEFATLAFDNQGGPRIAPWFYILCFALWPGVWTFVLWYRLRKG